MIEVLKVLVVDDQERWRKHITKVVKMSNLEPQTVDSGHEAVVRLCEDKFIAVITDVQMPLGSGIELCQWIDGWFKCPPPVYVHSSEDEIRSQGIVLNLPTLINESFGDFAEFHSKRGDWIEEMLEFLKRVSNQN